AASDVQIKGPESAVAAVIEAPVPEILSESAPPSPPPAIPSTLQSGNTAGATEVVMPQMGE
ncbi:MAG TPA: hypothetical protein DDW24_07635, partial [Blastocatellia bacterium]|nr:hypothetical protein [Blastocatellia bacterium]